MPAVMIPHCTLTTLSRFSWRTSASSTLAWLALISLICLLVRQSEARAAQHFPGEAVAARAMESAFALSTATVDGGNSYKGDLLATKQLLDEVIAAQATGSVFALSTATGDGVNSYKDGIFAEAVVAKATGSAFALSTATADGGNFHKGDLLATHIQLKLVDEFNNALSGSQCSTAPKRDLITSLTACTGAMAVEIIKEMGNSGKYADLVRSFPLKANVPHLAPKLAQQLPGVFLAGQKVGVSTTTLNVVAPLLLLLLYSQAVVKPATRGQIVIPADEFVSSATAKIATRTEKGSCPPYTLTPFDVNCGLNKGSADECICVGLIGRGQDGYLWHDCPCLLDKSPPPFEGDTSKSRVAAIEALSDGQTMTTPPDTVPTLTQTTSTADPLAAGDCAHCIPSNSDGSLVLDIVLYPPLDDYKTTSPLWEWSLSLKGRDVKLREGNVFSTAFIIPSFLGKLLVQWDGDINSNVNLIFTDLNNNQFKWDSAAAATTGVGTANPPRFSCATTSWAETSLTLSCKMRYRPSAPDKKLRIDINQEFYDIPQTSGGTKWANSITATLFADTSNEKITEQSFSGSKASLSGYPMEGTLTIAATHLTDIQSLIQFQYGTDNWYDTQRKNNKALDPNYCNDAAAKWVRGRFQKGQKRQFSCWFNNK